MRQVVYPVSLSFVQASFQPLDDYSVGYFHLSIGLRVSYRRENLSTVELFALGFEGIIGKLFHIFGDDFVRNSKLAYDILPEKLQNSLTCDRGQGLDFYPFGEVVNGDH